MGRARGRTPTLVHGWGIHNARIEVEQANFYEWVVGRSWERSFFHQPFDCGPSYHIRPPVARWMQEPIVARNGCTNERIVWTAPSAPTQRMKINPIEGFKHGADKRSWGEKTTDEIIEDIRRLTYPDEIRLTERQAEIMGAVARGERVYIVGGRRSQRTMMANVYERFVEGDNPFS